MIKQVKFFYDCDRLYLEEQVNKFCLENKVLDIKFSTETDPSRLYFCVCVIYLVGY